MNDLIKKKHQVLHLSIDYPSKFKKINTQAIKNFVKSTDEIDYFVFALTRTPNPFKVGALDGDNENDPKVLSMQYWGAGYGFLLSLSMFIVAIRVLIYIKKNNMNFDAIHSHKFCFEGIAGHFLSLWLKIPHIVSVRGESDSKVIKYKPHYIFLLRWMVRRCAFVYFVSAWIEDEFRKKLFIDPQKIGLLPNFIDTNNVVKYGFDHSSCKFVTVLDLNLYEKKGLDRLLPSFKDFLKNNPDYTLDIIGRGTFEKISEVDLLINSLELDKQVTYIGQVGNKELFSMFHQYCCLVLPSHNETFGMVYVEALLCGIPVIYSSGTGIHGYLNDIEPAIAVDPKSQESISEGLISLVYNKVEYAKWFYDNRKTVIERFDKEPYINSYIDFLDGV
jgi:glycosyltransferase involved in cell wall biosynthesis